jgi:membrane protease YdiL (CAAX protease family)
MSSFQLAALLTVACLALFRATGRLGFLSQEFPSGPRRLAAAALLLAVLAACVFYPAVSAEEVGAINPADLWFPALFFGHLVLVVFLLAWWRLRGNVRLLEFLRLDRSQVGDLRRGLLIGAVGWALTLGITAAIAPLVTRSGVLPEPQEVPELMRWMAQLSVWRKLTIVAAAMTVEEAFFRAFLQTRIGLVLSSVLFALSHAGYGLPLMLASVLVISLVIGWSLERTGRLLPCIVAHGVFDAVQLLVVIPWVIRTMTHGGAG